MWDWKKITLYKRNWRRVCLALDFMENRKFERLGCAFQYLQNCTEAGVDKLRWQYSMFCKLLTL